MSIAISTFTSQSEISISCGTISDISAMVNLEWHGPTIQMDISMSPEVTTLRYFPKHGRRDGKKVLTPEQLNLLSKALCGKKPMTYVDLLEEAHPNLKDPVKWKEEYQLIYWQINCLLDTKVKYYLEHQWKIENLPADNQEFYNKLPSKNLADLKRMLRRRKIRREKGDNGGSQLVLAIDLKVRRDDGKVCLPVYPVGKVVSEKHPDLCWIIRREDKGVLVDTINGDRYIVAFPSKHLAELHISKCKDRARGVTAGWIWWQDLIKEFGRPIKEEFGGTIKRVLFDGQFFNLE